MIGCVLSQLKPSELYILRCEKGRRSSSGFILYIIVSGIGMVVSQIKNSLGQIEGKLTYTGPYDRMLV